MSNLINWGAIYCESWWGDVDRTTLSIQNLAAPACFAPSNKIAEEFRDRVEADGGTLEGYYCLVAAIQDLGEDNYPEVWDTFILRMTNDGATIDGEQCLIEQLNNLN